MFLNGDFKFNVNPFILFEKNEILRIFFEKRKQCQLSIIKMGFGKFTIIEHVKFSGKDFPTNYTGNDLKILS